jgi:glycogen synthase kinase 3 beta
MSRLWILLFSIVLISVSSLEFSELVSYQSYSCRRLDSRWSDYYDPRRIPGANETNETSIGFWFSPNLEDHPKDKQFFLIGATTNKTVEEKTNILVSYDFKGLIILFDNEKTRVRIPLDMGAGSWYYVFVAVDANNNKTHVMVYDAENDKYQRVNGKYTGINGNFSSQDFKLYIGGGKQEMYYSCGAFMSLAAVGKYYEPKDISHARTAIIGYSNKVMHVVEYYFAQLATHVDKTTSWKLKTCYEYPLSLLNSIYNECPTVYEDFLHNRTHIESVEIDGKNCSIILERYIAEGGGGKVYLARILETGETVAYKKQRFGQEYSVAEIEMMKRLKHPNIINIRAVQAVPLNQTSNETALNLVLDYSPQDMYYVTYKYKRDRGAPPRLLRKVFLFQMFRSIAYVHSQGILHCDIKGPNFLVDEATNIVKLADFGSARWLDPNPEVEFSSYFGTEPYRAPELLFRAHHYSYPADIWSAGCVFAAFYNKGRHPFDATGNDNMLVEVMKVLGAPTEADLAAMKARRWNISLEVEATHNWTSWLKHPIEPDALELLEWIFQYDPEKRPTAWQAMQHRYFDDVKKESSYRQGITIPHLFDWTDNEKASWYDYYERLTPSWYKKKYNVVKWF